MGTGRYKCVLHVVYLCVCQQSECVLSTSGCVPTRTLCCVCSRGQWWWWLGVGCGSVRCSGSVGCKLALLRLDFGCSGQPLGWLLVVGWCWLGVGCGWLVLVTHTASRRLLRRGRYRFTLAVCSTLSLLHHEGASTTDRSSIFPSSAVLLCLVVSLHRG